MVKALIALLIIVGGVTVALLVGGKQEGPPPDPDARDRAFTQAMVPHHESAIAMAEIAMARATVPEIKKLANDIVSAQAREIAQLKAIHQRRFGTPLQVDVRAHEVLGLSASEAGMNHGDEGSLSALREANPFEGAFIGAMTPHHEGAIRMARAVLETTADEDIKRLANDIIRAQEEETRLMADVQKRYGFPSASPAPAGGHDLH